MNSSPAQRRFFRLQFSLRSILLLMFLVGAGIAVYRWPWEETTPGPEKLLEPATIVRKTVTTWRRGWRGRPVKDGPERRYLNGDLVEELCYREGQLHGCCRSFYWDNRCTEERNFRSGVLQGPYRIGNGETWVYEGQYDRGQRDGSWRVLTGKDGLEQDWFDLADHGVYVAGTEPRHRLEVPAGAIEVRQTWRRGKRHGHWEWRTLQGELINSVEYADNQLTHWNGDDAAEQFWNRVREFVLEHDPVLLSLLQLPAADLAERNGSNSLPRRKSTILRFPRRTETDFVIGGIQLAGNPTGERRGIHFAAAPSLNPFQHAENSIGSNLLEFALFEGLAVEYRFGGLWFVPAEEARGFRDAPGADRIQFAAGSLQEASWTENIPFDFAASLNLSSVQHLLAKTAIDSFFTEGLDKENSVFVSGPTYLLPNRVQSQRTRGDVIGLALYRLNASCELRDDTLVVKPHWTRESR